MKTISRFQFITCVANKLPQEVLRKLGSAEIFLEHAGTVFFIRSKGDQAWIGAAAGKGMEWCRELSKELRKTGIRLVGFMTSEYNEPVVKMAQYYGATFKKIPYRYLDGSQGVECWLSLDGRRFKHG